MYTYFFGSIVHAKSTLECRRHPYRWPIPLCVPKKEALRGKGCTSYLIDDLVIEPSAINCSGTRLAGPIMARSSEIVFGAHRTGERRAIE